MLKEFNDTNDLTVVSALRDSKASPMGSPNKSRTIAEPVFEGAEKPLSVRSSAVPHQTMAIAEFLNKEWLGACHKF